MLRKVFAVALLAVIAIAMIATSVYAEGTEVHGFSFSTASISWKERKEEAVDRRFHSGHTWLIVSQKVGSFEAFSILAPVGPPKYVHNLQLNWKNPIKGLSNITLGRTQPTFGNEWVKRIDRLSTINYSLITKPLVARDVGVTLNGKLPHLDWTVGVFAGQRTGGNVPISHRGELDGYARLIGTLPFGVQAGISSRFGHVRALGGDLSVKVKNVTFTGEIVSAQETAFSSQKVAAYHYLVEYAVTPRLLAVLRYEHLEAGERVFTSGLAFKPLGDHEVKLNYIASKQNPNGLNAQFVLRW